MTLASTYSALFRGIQWPLVLLAAGLFIAGMASAPLVIRGNITWLLRYPMWIAARIERLLARERGFFPLFALIFTLNTTSLLFDFISGWGVALPYLLAFLTGLNVAIIAVRTGGKLGLLAMLLNPVALFELPAAWIAMALGMQLGNTVWLGESRWAHFRFGFDGFMHITVPLLAIAAVLEAALIAAFQRRPYSDGE